MCPALRSLLLAATAAFAATAQAELVTLRYDGTVRAFSDNALSPASSLATLATDSGVAAVAGGGTIAMAVELTIDTASAAVPLATGWSRYFDAVQSATLVLGDVRMTMTREATGASGLGVDNTLDLRTSPYAPMHSAGVYAYQGNSGAYRMVYTPTVSGSRGNFGYVMRDFYAVLDALAIDSADLGDLPAMFEQPVTGPAGTGVNFHVGVDFIDPTWVIGAFPGGGNQYAQVGPTVSFNGRLDRVSLLTVPDGGTVPEPGTPALVLVAGALALVLRRRALSARAAPHA